MNRVIVKEYHDICDSVATNILQLIRPQIEKECCFKFKGEHLHGRSRIVPYKGRRHPISILEKPNPFICIGFTTDVEKTDLVYGASTFGTDVSSYIDPKEFTDMVFYNTNRTDTSKDIEVRLSFDNVEMTCDIALLFDTTAHQIQTKRVWEILYEYNREYEINTTIKFPISDEILEYWCNLFGLDNSDLDVVMSDLQFRSEFLLTREVQQSSKRERIFINYPANLRVTMDRVESSSTDEHGNTSLTKVIARVMNIKFNAPTIYYITPRSYVPEFKTPNSTLKNIGSITGDLVDDLLLQKSCVYHESFTFPTSTCNIRDLLSDYEPFLRYVENTHGTFDTAIYILIRDASNDKNNTSIVSEEYIDIGYKSLTLRCKDVTKLNKKFDIRIYLDNNVHAQYLDYTTRNNTIHDRRDVIDIHNRETEDIEMSDALKELI